MEDFLDLIREKDELPKGNIYRKTIKGKVYFYHQYSSFGKRYCVLLDAERAGLLKKEIAKRKRIEKQIAEIFAPKPRHLTLSPSMKKMTGYLMNEDKVVAEFLEGEVIRLDEKLCPLVILRTRRLEPFLSLRTIDLTRTNSRILRKAMNLPYGDPLLLSLSQYATSVSDSYWFKPKHSKLHYRDVICRMNPFFDAALTGRVTYVAKSASLSPDIVTGGSYEKAWKNIDGQWWLYKSGKEEEIFSELFYASLMERLSLPTAHYERSGAYIRSLNFSPKTNFEPVASIAGEDDSYEHVYVSLKKVSPHASRAYLRLCYYDVILNNVDRHNENCGILRLRDTGEILGLAPNYDDNLCLIARSKELPLVENEGFLQSFLRFLKANKEAREDLKVARLPLITRVAIEDVLEGLPSPLPTESIINFLLFRQKTLRDFLFA